MYENLTVFISQFKDSQFGEWIVDRKNDGSPEHPIQLPFVAYNKVTMRFIDEVYQFVADHKSFELNRYDEILGKAGIHWSSDSMLNASVSELDGITVMALIVGILRADRFSEGTLVEFLENGCITKWLLRLQQIDSEQYPE